MGELAAEYKQKIANFDGDSKVNNQEKDVIFYVEAYARTMPPEYLNKLIEAIKNKLKDKQLNKIQIGIECENAIKELNDKIEKMRKRKETKTENQTIGEQVSSFIDKNVFSQIYRHTEGLSQETQIDEQIQKSKVPMIKKISVDPELKMVIYQAVEVTVFEKEIKTTPTNKINSHALANYFKHLHKMHELNPETLIQKFGEKVLLELGIFWRKGGTDLIAYKTLQENGLSYIIDMVVNLSSDNNMFQHIKTLRKTEEQELVILLLQEREGSLKEKFKKEMKTELMAKQRTMKENEANIIVEELLLEVLKYKGIHGLPKIYKIFDDYSKKYEVPVDQKKATAQIQEIRETRGKLSTARILNERSKTQDPKKIKELDKKLKEQEQESKEERIAVEINKKMKESDIKALTSGEKNIEQVVEELRKEDKEFNMIYTTWQRSIPLQEKSAVETPIASSRRSDIPFRGIDNGTPHMISLDRQSEHSDILTITRDGGLYAIKLGNDTTTLPKENVPAYIQSLQFMEKLGLGYFLRNLPQNKLSQILESTSRNTTRVDNQDGNFDEIEKKRILYSFGRLLNIDTDNNRGIKDEMAQFNSSLSRESSSYIESILVSKNILQNGSLNPEALKMAIKST